MTTGNNKVAKNALWIIGCKIVQSLVGLAVGMITARYLGPSNYGLINYAASITAFVLPLVQLGLCNVIVEELVSSPGEEGQTFGTVFTLELCSGVLGMAGIFAFVSLANRGEADTLKVCMLYSISMFCQITEMIQYWYQAKLMSKYTSVVSLIAYISVALYKIFLLVTQKSIYWFAVSTALDSLLISVILIAVYIKLGGQRYRFSIRKARKLLSKSKYYILANMMVVVYSQSDRIMLKLMCDDAQSGFYSAAIACAGIAGFVFTAIIDSFRPMLFEKKKNDQEGFELGIVRLYSIIIYLGLLMSIVFTLLSKLLIYLMYGAEFAPSAAILRIITWYLSISYIASVRNIWMLAEDKYRYLWIIDMTGAVSNIVLNLTLIPTLGAVGAALASVITRFIANFVLCFIMKPIRPTVKLMLTAFNPKVLINMIPKRNR